MAMKIPFGKYSGKTVEQIAESDDGLLYLDWLRGKDWLSRTLAVEIGEYLDDPTIAKELKDLIDERKANE